MDALFGLDATKAISVTLLAAGACIVTRIWRNPYVGRALWAAVLIKFIAPSLIPIPAPTALTWSFAATSAGEAVIAAGVVPGRWETPASKHSRSGSVPPQAHDRAHSQADALQVAGERAGGWFAPAFFAKTAKLFWAGGSAVLAGVVILRVLQFHLLIAGARVASDHVQKVARRLAAMLHVPRVSVHTTDGNVPPLVWCLGRQPIVLLPSNLLDRLTESELSAVLAHEIMHVKRRDGLMRWLELVVVTLYWWCPVVWFARRQLQQQEERCCDADVVRAFPELRRSYAIALLKTVDQLSGHHGHCLGSMGFASEHSLTRRFEMILSQRHDLKPRRSIRAGLWTAIATAVVSSPMSSVTAETVEPAADQHVAAHPAAKPVHQSSEAVWRLSLAECIALSLESDGLVRVVRRTEEPTILVYAGSGETDGRQLKKHVENTVIDVGDCYWTLWEATRGLEAVREGRGKALQLWRQVQAIAETDGDDSDEAKCRAQYFSFRTQAETASTNRHRTESRLRYLLEISGNDGRMIAPQDDPREENVKWESNKVTAEARALDADAHGQRDKIRRNQAKLDRLLETPTDGMSDLTRRRHVARVNHHRLVMARETAVLGDLELQIDHHTTNALRNADLAFNAMAINRNRTEAAMQEEAAIEGPYDLWRIEIDVLLDRQKRTVHAKIAEISSRADFMRAHQRVRLRKGDLLKEHGIKIADGGGP